MREMKLEIKSPRQLRAIEALRHNKNGIACKDLGKIIGALNPAQTIMELREKGFSIIILTEFLEVLDRDGKVCRPGKYRLLDGFETEIQQAIDEYKNSAKYRIKFNKRGRNASS